MKNTPTRMRARLGAEAQRAAAATDRMLGGCGLETGLMACLGAIALTVYGLTLAEGFVPGRSAEAAARALDLLPGAAAANPLWLLLARGVARLPLGDAWLRLNLLSALFGGLSAAWLFRLVRRVLFEFIREPPPATLLRDDAAERAAAAPPTCPAARDVREHGFAIAGGLLAALALAFSAPFWSAATACGAQTFSVLLLLLVADQTARYVFRGNTGACVAAAVLLGLGLVEEPSLAWAAPLVVGALLLASARFDQLSESLLLLLLGAGLCGLTANVLLVLLHTASPGAFTPEHLYRALTGLLRSHLRSLSATLPAADGLFVLFQTVVPLGVALVSLRLVPALQDEVNRWKWGFINLLLTGYALGALLNAPKTAWALARPDGGLPVFAALSLAAAAGALFAYWCIAAVTVPREVLDETAPPSSAVRLLAYGLCGLLLIVVLRAPHSNAADVTGHAAAAVDRLADTVLGQLGAARCLLTDGTLDLHLLIRARLRRMPLTVVPGEASPEPPADGAGRPPALSLAMRGGQHGQRLNDFVSQWLRAHPDATAQLASVGQPGLWRRAGLKALPNGLVYTGAPADAPVDGPALLADNRAQWRRVTALLAAADARPLRPDQRRVLDRVRRLASRMANDLGVLLEAESSPDAAEAAYREALDIDPANLSAALNRGGLALGGACAGSPCDTTQALVARARDGRFFDTFSAAVAASGALAPRQADVLLPACLAAYPLSAKPPAELFRLLHLWLQAAAPTPPRPAVLAYIQPPAAGTPDVKMTQAVEKMLDGQHVMAEKLLRLVLMSRPTHLQAWTLLAELLMNRGAFPEVKETVLPTMLALTATTNSPLVEMTRGTLRLRDKPADAAGARLCFERAISLLPSLEAAHRALLQADLQLGNAALLEQDALRVLRPFPEHALANALLGSLRLHQGRFDEAERRLRASLAAEPTAAAANDLAELLRRTGRHALAEEQARRALRLEADFLPAWDTLANALLDQGRLDDAYGPLRCAFALKPEDPAACLTLARLLIEKGETQEARRLLAHFDSRLPGASPHVITEYARLKRALP